ncbi:hypothetical protein DSO57_1022327 [Entomophthora muscae]|uniref:Uncharacterized protein n=2 Tax=Entomophthora muscae TaxID=34485 RepID=A0ACC2T3A2_9FUNG|nr:hypothetical protein DSO57_1019681 [Entomophthora muscae]KAJ9069052.1 hypothetical protein DSO57_1022327 [Entomophthora muscae]
MSAYSQDALQSASLERQAFGIGLNKLKSAKSSSLCKRVLLINSMGSLLQATPSVGVGNLPTKFQSKDDWRRYMVREFLTTQTNPDVSFKIISSPKALKVDSLSILMDCLHISQKKRVTSGPKIRTVLKKTISKHTRKSRT